MATLSEIDSKSLLERYGVPLVEDRLVRGAEEAVVAARALGYPVVLKLCGDTIAHKTERGLVRLRLTDDDAVRQAAGELLDAATEEDGDVALLVAPMLSATREFIAGISHDEQFGPTVLLGLGGVLAEALGDVVVRLVPITELDAHDMLDGLRTQDLLGAFRGEPPVDREALVRLLLALSTAAQQEPTLRSADLNPILVVQGEPIAVDALVEQDDR